MARDCLAVAGVLRPHQDQLGRSGGAAGLRSMALLQSAVAQPAATLDGAFPHTDPPEMAAAHPWRLLRGHLQTAGRS